MPINERARLDYLKSMGLTQWVAKKPLEGAAPSPRLVPVGQPTPKEQAAVGRPSVEELKSSIANAGADAVVKSLSDEFKASRKRDTMVAQDTPKIRLNLTVFTQDDVLILCEQPLIDGVLGLQYPHRVLIADALRILLGVNNSEALREDDFIWPWGAEAYGQGGCIEDAKLALSALVAARPPRVTLLIGDQLAPLMPAEGNQLQAVGFDQLLQDSAQRVALANQLLAKAGI